MLKKEEVQLKLIKFRFTVQQLAFFTEDRAFACAPVGSTHS